MKLGAISAALLVAGTAYAQACTVTNTFVNGTTADAAQVNQNFSDVLNCFNNPVFSGSVGINTTPATVLHILDNVNGVARILLNNPSTGSSADAELRLSNGSSNLQLSINGTGTGAPNVSYINASYDIGLIYGAGGGSHVFTIQSGGTEAGRFNGQGELLLGSTTDQGAYLLQVNSQIWATSGTIATSDARLKHLLGYPSKRLLDGALAIPTRLYTRKDHPEYGKRAGYWAQDWLKVLNSQGLIAGGPSGTAAAGMVPMNSDGHYGLDEEAVHTLKIAALEHKLSELTSGQAKMLRSQAWFQAELKRKEGEIAFLRAVRQSHERDFDLLRARLEKLENGSGLHTVALQ